MEQVEEAEQMQYIELERIRVQPGFNHRKKFNSAAHESLIESIKAQGVVQPIILRPDPDLINDFTVVAGERRYRASIAAGRATIKAIVRQLSDRQALAVALVENKDRLDITPAEEAATARLAVDQCEGDEAEACRLLGWSHDRLKSRLLLLNAIPAALDALADKKIKLGHAELLATLPADLQAVVLDNILKNKASVEDLATQLGRRAQELSKAIFDTAGCKGCQYNSAQAQLFDTHINDGLCSNAACWKQKTDVALIDLRTVMQQEVPLVHFDRDKDPQTYTAVSADTVGDDQYAQGCKGCGHFGALMATAPGKEGTVSHSICFDTGCNRKKVAAFQASQAPKADDKSVTSAAKGGKAGKPGSKNKKHGKPTGKAKTSASAASVPSKVLDNIDEFVRAEASKQVYGLPRVLAAMQLFALRSLAGKHKSEDTGSRMSAILRMSDSEIATEQLTIASDVLATGKTSNHSILSAGSWSFAAARVLEDAHVDLAGKFPITKAYLEAHTKSGLEALLDAAGFANSLDGATEEDRDKALRKLVGGKHPDIVRAVLASKHDFGGTFLPPNVQTRLTTLTTSKRG